MKILIVASYNKGRFVPFVAEQGAALQRAGCKVEWFGIQGHGLLGYIRELPGLRKMICDVKPDIIHAHYGLSCLLANLATRRVPVVSTYHGSDINESVGRKFSRLAMSLSAHNIFVSERIMDIAHANKRSDSTLIPCGVALSEEQLQTRIEACKVLGWRLDEKIVLFAGAFDNPVKDSPLAKSAISYLQSKMGSNDIRLIELKGYTREQVNTLMCAANCLLMTSKTEGSPQVIKEALACGCPIVSVDVGDVAERTSGVEGCYVVLIREPRELAEALENAIAFEGKTKGRERIIEEGLTNEQIAKRIIAIYEDVMNDKLANENTRTQEYESFRIY